MWLKIRPHRSFNVEDHFDYAKYNQILWKGMLGDKPYPQVTGLDLRTIRDESPFSARIRGMTSSRI